MYENKELNEIEEIFGFGWYSKVLNENPQIKSLPIDQQIEWIRNNSIHGQTYFFRDNLINSTIENYVIPSCDKLPSRLAFVGCSDGREVYSVLVQGWKKEDSFQLTGYDSNPELIQEAKNGGSEIKINSKGFRINSTYSVENYLLDEWNKFGAKDYAYIVTPQQNNSSWSDITMTKSARKKVAFEIHNIVKGPLPKIYDAIIISNVLCHYAIKGREIIIKNIAKSLNQNGWLIAESYVSGSANSAKEYDTFMNNLSSLGFEKQKIVIPTYFSQTHDVSSWSRAYRKKF